MRILSCDSTTRPYASVEVGAFPRCLRRWMARRPVSTGEHPSHALPTRTIGPHAPFTTFDSDNRVQSNIASLTPSLSARSPSMKQQLTPSYDHEKVANPTSTDLIDVFEDAWNGYVLAQVQVLLSSPNGDIAAMTLLCSYFESIEALYRGEFSVQ